MRSHYVQCYVGIVRSRTKATEFSLVSLVSLVMVVYGTDSRKKAGNKIS